MSKPTNQLHKPGHHYALNRLSSYMDGKLPDREQTRVQAHLDACADCRQELRTLRWTRDLTQQMPILPVPRSFIVREADLEAATAARSQSRFAGALAGLQAAAAIVAVLLVLVVVGDLYAGGRHVVDQAAPVLSMRATNDASVAKDIQAGAAEAPASPTSQLPIPEIDAQPKMALVAHPTETAPNPTAAPVEPTPEPSPTWTTRPTRTPTPPGSPAESTLTKRSPTPQPTETATTAPAATPTTAPIPTNEPTQTVRPPLRAMPTSSPQPQPVVKVLISPTLEQAKVEEVESVGIDPTPVKQSEQTEQSWQASQRQIWRLAQAALGAILIGLLAAIVYLRTSGRAG